MEKCAGCSRLGVRRVELLPTESVLSCCGLYERMTVMRGMSVNVSGGNAGRKERQTSWVEGPSARLIHSGDLKVICLLGEIEQGHLHSGRMT